MQCLIKVPFNDLSAQHSAIKAQLLKSVEKVLEHGKFVLGPEVESFEQKFLALSGAKYAVGVANGTDAIILALKALGIGAGDEVITVANTYVTTVSSIILVGATPVFVDVLNDYTMDPAKIEAAITAKTKAILPVHLTGAPADMKKIVEIAKKHKLKVIEDAAQAVGAITDGKPVGAWGDVGCFSLHPLKTLNACGDGGVITTNDAALYEQFKLLRNNGCSSRDECLLWSGNSRLDTMQAAMLLVKLNYFDQWTKKRIAHAEFYLKELKNIKEVDLPPVKKNAKAVYHTFVIQADNRDGLKDFLEKNGIKTKLHYPKAVHQQPVAKSFADVGKNLPNTERQAKRIISLPVHQDLTKEQLNYVVEKIKEFYKEE